MVASLWRAQRKDYVFSEEDTARFTSLSLMSEWLQNSPSPTRGTTGPTGLKSVLAAAPTSPLSGPPWALQSFCVVAIAWGGDLWIPRSDHTRQKAFLLLVEGTAGSERGGV